MEASRKSQSSAPAWAASPPPRPCARSASTCRSTSRHRFARIGAGIQMLPNSMKVLRGIGIEEKLREFAFAP